MSYRLRQADLAKLGGKAQVEKLAEGSANVTLHDNDGTVEVKQSFAPAKMPICVKSAEIVIDKQGPAGECAGCRIAQDTRGDLGTADQACRRQLTDPRPHG